MYYFTFALTMLTPLSMLLVAILWRVHPPKLEGSRLAYRTPLSTRSQETWDFAHKHISRLWLRIGLLLVILTVALMVFLKENASSFFLWLIAGQMAFLCISAFLVDGMLKTSFDENGKSL